MSANLKLLVYMLGGYISKTARLLSSEMFKLPKTGFIGHHARSVKFLNQSLWILHSHMENETTFFIGIKTAVSLDIGSMIPKRRIVDL